MSEAKWYCLRDGKEVGPLGRDQLKQMADAGVVRPEDSVRREGDAKWVPASRVRGLCPEPAPKAEPPPQVPIAPLVVLERTAPTAADASPGLGPTSPERPQFQRAAVTESDAKLAAIADRHQWLIRSTLLYLVVILASGFRLLYGEVDLVRLLSHASLALMIASWPVFCFRLARALDLTPVPYTLAAAVPLVNLVVLIDLNGRATRTLRAAGVRVGLLGGHVGRTRGADPLVVLAEPHRRPVLRLLGSCLALLGVSIVILCTLGGALYWIAKPREPATRSADAPERPRTPATRKLSFGDQQFLYWGDDSLSDDAPRVGDALRETGFFDGKKGRDVILGREGSDVFVRVFVKAEAIGRPSVHALFGDGLGVRLAAKAFAGRSLVVKICDESGQDRHTTRCGPSSQYRVTPACTIYHDDTLWAEARRLGELIKRERIETAVPEWVLTSKGSVLVAYPGQMGVTFAPEERTLLRELSKRISEQAITSQRVEVRATVGDSLETFLSGR